MSRFRKLYGGCGLLAIASLFSACRDTAPPGRRSEDSGTLPPNCVPRPLGIVRKHSMNGPLRIHPDNPRYFTDGDGKAILLVGSHTWTNLQDSGYEDPLPRFDYHAYLDFLEAHNHNFFRLWYQEQTCWIHATERRVYWSPHPYQRTGPGAGIDGKPKFDLTAFNEDYFDRLRSRVLDAQNRGIYSAIMLFDGWSITKAKGQWRQGNPWRGHPFHPQNNINGINGDPSGDDSGEETHELTVPAVTAIQEAYVRKVIDTVNDLDNVLYEISNESQANSVKWEYHMIRLIKSYEATKPKQHPVGMSVIWPEGNNQDLLVSPADWIAPKEHEGDVLMNKGKVVLDDTDHWFGIGGDRKWAWERFMAGANPVFMDAYDVSSYREDDNIGGFRTTEPRWMSLRLNLGYIQTYANRLSVVAMTPRKELASTGYCLANPGSPGAQYLIYLPRGGDVIVDLSGLQRHLSVEWFDPSTGLVLRGVKCDGGAKQRFQSPFDGDSVLFLDQCSN